MAYAYTLFPASSGQKNFSCDARKQPDSNYSVAIERISLLIDQQLQANSLVGLELLYPKRCFFYLEMQRAFAALCDATSALILDSDSAENHFLMAQVFSLLRLDGYAKFALQLGNEKKQEQVFLDESSFAAKLCKPTTTCKGNPQVSRELLHVASKEPLIFCNEFTPVPAEWCNENINHWTALWVGNFQHKLSPSEIYKQFAMFGVISYCDVRKCEKTLKKCALIHYYPGNWKSPIAAKKNFPAAYGAQFEAIDIRYRYDYSTTTSYKRRLYSRSQTKN